MALSDQATQDVDWMRRADAAFTDFHNVSAEVIRLNAETARMSARLDAQVSDLANLSRALQDFVGEFKASFANLSRQFEDSRKPNLQLLSLVVVLVGGMWALINNQITNNIQPLNTEIAQLKTGSDEVVKDLHDVTALQATQGQQQIGSTLQVTSNSADIKIMQQQIEKLQQASASSEEADAESRTNRSELSSLTSRLSTDLAQEIADRRAADASFSTHLGEIETQFHGVTDDVNQNKSHFEQTFGLLWPKVFGTAYPASTYYPHSMFQTDGNVK